MERANGLEEDLAASNLEVIFAIQIGLNWALCKSFFLSVTFRIEEIKMNGKGCRL